MNQPSEDKTLPPEIENEETFLSHNLGPARTRRNANFRAELSQKLRTPLNAIIGFAELVAMRSGTAAKDPDVQHILKAARDLLEIINRELADPNVPPKSAPSLVPPISCDVLYIEDDLGEFHLGGANPGISANAKAAPCRQR